MMYLFAIVAVGLSSVAAIASVVAWKGSESAKAAATELRRDMYFRELGIASDIRGIREELDLNERSHGYMEAQIKDIARLKAVDDMRAEALKASGGGND